MFALLTPVAALVIRRAGAELALLISLSGVLIGTFVRALPGFGWMLAGMLVIGASITIGNVVIPVIIRRDVPPAARRPGDRGVRGDAQRRIAADGAADRAARGASSAGRSRCSHGRRSPSRASCCGASICGAHARAGSEWRRAVQRRSARGSPERMPRPARSRPASLTGPLPVVAGRGAFAAAPSGHLAARCRFRRAVHDLLRAVDVAADPHGGRARSRRDGGRRAGVALPGRGRGRRIPRPAAHALHAAARPSADDLRVVDHRDGRHPALAGAHVALARRSARSVTPAGSS